MHTHLNNKYTHADATAYHKVTLGPAVCRTQEGTDTHATHVHTLSNRAKGYSYGDTDNQTYAHLLAHTHKEVNNKFTLMPMHSHTTRCVLVNKASFNRGSAAYTPFVSLS